VWVDDPRPQQRHCRVSVLISVESGFERRARIVHVQSRTQRAEVVMSMNIRCSECGGRSAYAGHDERGAFYTCETADPRCVVFDHWAEDVRTYRSTYRGSYEGPGADEE
jgi:hypothetical protein